MVKHRYYHLLVAVRLLSPGCVSSHMTGLSFVGISCNWQWKASFVFLTASKPLKLLASNNNIIPWRNAQWIELTPEIFVLPITLKWLMKVNCFQTGDGRNIWCRRTGASNGKSIFWLHPVMRTCEHLSDGDSGWRNSISQWDSAQFVW